jgi:nickel-dependent lactate racemase
MIRRGEMDLISVQLAYGHGQFTVNVPKRHLLGVFNPKNLEEDFDEGDEIRRALENPIGTRRLRDLASNEERIVIVTSDLTRPCPSARLLPYILRELELAAVPSENITIVLALGLHRVMESEEIDSIVTPEIRRRYRVINHDLSDTVRIGFTQRGTPVEIFRPVIDADMRICLGNLEYHYFAGYTGGAKAIFPGCASRLAVTANHTMLILPEAATGRNEGNPLRLDLEEAATMVGVDFILNVIVDEEHRIVGAVAGDVIAAHRVGCSMVASRGTVKIPKQADIVIASAGGFPKDINFFQSHKVLENCKHFVKEGGVIILAAECREGYGNPVFEEWMLAASSPDEILARFQKGFVLGGHKAAAMAKLQKRAKIYLVSEMPDEVVISSGMSPFEDPQLALSAAMDELSPGSEVIVLPQALSLIPEIAG